MSLSHKHVGSKIPAKINTFMLTRAELLIHLCYEIPCTWSKWNLANFFALMDHLPWTSFQHFGLLTIRPEYA
jgi:hypothetical protein